MREISMNKNAIREAAKYVFINNGYLENWCYRDIYDKITNHVRQVVNNAHTNWESTYISSAGWDVVFRPETDKYGSIEILVDPCVSKDYGYVNVEDVI